MLLFFALAFLSEIIGTVAGFGSSVFFVPLAGFFFEFHEVLALTSVLHVFSNAAKLLFFGRAISYRLLLLLGLPSLVGVVAGAYASTRLQFKFTEIVLGIFLLAFSIFFLVSPRTKLSANPAASISAGGIAGFLAGLIGTGGAVRGLALAAFDLEKNVFVATSAAIDTGVDLSRMFIYLSHDFLPAALIFYLPGLLAVALAGSFIGKLVLNRIEQRTFRRGVLVLIFVIGVIEVAKTFI